MTRNSYDVLSGYMVDVEETITILQHVKNAEANAEVGQRVVSISLSWLFPLSAVVLSISLAYFTITRQYFLCVTFLQSLFSLFRVREY